MVSYLNAQDDADAFSSSGLRGLEDNIGAADDQCDVVAYGKISMLNSKRNR